MILRVSYVDVVHVLGIICLGDPSACAALTVRRLKFSITSKLVQLDLLTKLLEVSMTRQKPKTITGSGGPTPAKKRVGLPGTDIFVTRNDLSCGVERIVGRRILARI